MPLAGAQPDIRRMAACHRALNQDVRVAIFAVEEHIAGGVRWPIVHRPSQTARGVSRGGEPLSSDRCPGNWAPNRSRFGASETFQIGLVPCRETSGGNEPTIRPRW